MSVDSIHKKLGANAWPVLLPLGKEDQLRGQLDVINKKAIIYSEDDQLGSTYEVTDLPKEYVEIVDRRTTIWSNKFPISMMTSPRPSSMKSRLRLSC